MTEFLHCGEGNGENSQGEPIDEQCVFADSNVIDTHDYHLERTHYGIGKKGAGPCQGRVCEGFLKEEKGIIASAYCSTCDGNIIGYTEI